MKKLVDTLGAVLIALGLCILPARADVLGGEVLATAAGVMVLLILAWWSWPSACWWMPSESGEKTRRTMTNEMV